MKRKDIEKAAKKQLKGIVPCEWNQEPFIDLFVRAADWRINSVWHDVSEKPQKNDVLIAVLNKYGIKTDFWCDFCGWDKYVRLDKIEKWAYIEDLIPNTED